MRIAELLFIVLTFVLQFYSLQIPNTLDVMYYEAMIALWQIHTLTGTILLGLDIHCMAQGST